MRALYWVVRTPARSISTFPLGKKERENRRSGVFGALISVTLHLLVRALRAWKLVGSALIWGGACLLMIDSN